MTHRVVLTRRADPDRGLLTEFDQFRLSSRRSRLRPANITSLSHLGAIPGA